jgi:hypothetical protein
MRGETRLSGSGRVPPEKDPLRRAPSHPALRISVINWSADGSDVDRSVEAILRCASDKPPPAPPQPINEG